MKSSTFEPNRDEVTGFVNGKRVNALATRSVEELKQNIQALQKGGNLSVPLDYLLKCIEQYLENQGTDEYRIITEFWELE